jgi:YNFM family putative membrane transporter
MVRVSFTVSAVILGIAISTLPFGILADRLPIHPIVLTGGVMVALGGLICAMTANLSLLIGTRFLQGLFIPALTTCLAAYLARALPAERLNVVMGSYVAATVLGGMGGRLLGGWIHSLINWRFAFVSASLLMLMATVAAMKWLPRSDSDMQGSQSLVGFRELLSRWDLVRICLVAAGSFAVFSSVFNYLPFRLNGSPFNLSTEVTTSLYLVYIIGIFTGPLSGRVSNRIGSGSALIGGSAVLALSLLLILLYSIPAVVAGLTGVCAGFFAIHSVAVGSLNRKLHSGQGRANALYVLFYYLGGWLGITCSGIAYQVGGWNLVVTICLLLLTVPLAAGVGELNRSR